jgi:peptide/nickel transport system permease protein
MTLIVQWTDALVYALVLASTLLIIYSRKKPNFQKFKNILYYTLRYKISAIILLIFILIGVLDSIHFKSSENSNKIVSVVDIMLKPFSGNDFYSPPSRAHPFGTDKVGRDVLYLTIKSIRTALIIGTVTTLFMLPLALLFGLWAGYFRGLVDDMIQYLYTTLSSVPGILLIAAAMLSFQVKVEANPDLRLIILCLILGVTSWTSLCRLLRGEALKLREIDFVLAAKTLGVTQFNIILRHILPNVMHIVIITVVLDFSGLVLAEAVLTYVGIGVDPTSYSFGNLINASRLEMARDPVVWWSLTAALSFMLALVLSANLLGDALQNALDPRHEGERA